MEEEITNLNKTSDELITQDDKPNDKVICGFWLRLWALFIDIIILVIISALLGIFLADFFVALGRLGWLVGFVLLLIYSGLGNSRLTKGQSIGKYLTKIQVTDANGMYLSVQRSFLRAFIFGLSFFSSSLFTLFSSTMLIQRVLEFVTSGLGIGLVYFYLFNRRTRQTIHDLVLNTYVVKKGGEGEVKTNPIWKEHFIIFLVITFLAFSSIESLNQFFARGIPKELMPVTQKLSNIEEVTNTSVMIGNSFGASGSNTYITVNLNVKDKNQGDYEKIANEAVIRLFKEYPDAEKKDLIVVQIVYGYDVGFWRLNKSYTYIHSPSDWHKS